MKKEKFKRAYHINSYQWPIILISIIPLMVLCLFLGMLMKVFFDALQNLLVYGNITVVSDFLQDWLVILAGFLWGFFIISFIVAYNVSLRLVGAFERIIKEFDRMLNANQYTHLHCRDKDKLAIELVKRINQLIDRLLNNNNQNFN